MQTPQSADVFSAIADPTRRGILDLLVSSGQNLAIKEIAVQFPISRQAVTKHLRILQGAGLVRMHDRGREKICIPTPASLRTVEQWVAAYSEFWERKLDALDAHLGEMPDS